MGHGNIHKETKVIKNIPEAQPIELNQSSELTELSISEQETNINPQRVRKESRVAAFTFERAPYADELQTKDLKAKFNNLPSWQRQFIKRIIEHQNIRQAGSEVGITKELDKFDESIYQRMTIKEALHRGGLTNDVLVQHLLLCLEAKVVRFDKYQNPVTFVDLELKRKTVETIFRVLGFMESAKTNVKALPVASEELYKQIPVNED